MTRKKESDARVGEGATKRRLKGLLGSLFGKESSKDRFLQAILKYTVTMMLGEVGPDRVRNLVLGVYEDEEFWKDAERAYWAAREWWVKEGAKLFPSGTKRGMLKYGRKS